MSIELAVSFTGLRFENPFLLASAPPTESDSNIIRAVDLALSQPAGWTAPREYLATNVAQTVSKIVLGYTNLRKHIS